MSAPAKRLTRLLQPGRLGWTLTGAGAVVLVLLSVIADPASADEPARIVATAAFAAAQLGLLIVAFTVFRQLYVRAGRTGRRRGAGGASRNET